MVKLQTTPKLKQEFVLKGERYVFVRQAVESCNGEIELSQLKDGESLFYPSFIYRNAGRAP